MSTSKEKMAELDEACKGLHSVINQPIVKNVLSAEVIGGFVRAMSTIEGELNRLYNAEKERNNKSSTILNGGKTPGNPSPPARGNHPKKDPASA